MTYHEELKQLRSQILVGADSRYDSQFIKLIDILLENSTVPRTPAEDTGETGRGEDSTHSGMNRADEEATPRVEK